MSQQVWRPLQVPKHRDRTAGLHQAAARQSKPSTSCPYSPTSNRRRSAAITRRTPATFWMIAILSQATQLQTSGKDRARAAVKTAPAMRRAEEGVPALGL